MLTEQYDRASFLLESTGLLQLYACARYLAAKCKVAKDEWEEALDILGDGPALDQPVNLHTHARTHARTHQHQHQPPLQYADELFNL